MGGFLTYTIAGAGFILIGARESVTSTSSITTTSQNPSSIQASSLNSTTKTKAIQSSLLTHITISIFSFLFIVNSLVSLFDGVNSRDQIGSALQLQVLAIACLFLFYSILGLLPFKFPSSILNMIALFGFVEEFLLFYLQRKDKSGIENRYFDLMLVPISICVVSTVIELKNPWKSNSYARLSRGVGLILQGMWFVQMGISFYTSLIVHGCSLHEKSRGNYTIKCKGHPEYHRGRGIATLLFNIHLALLVVLLMSVYPIMTAKNGIHSDFIQYKPLVAEMQQMESHGQFTLDSDEDEIAEEENAARETGVIVEVGVNGHVSHA